MLIKVRQRNAQLPHTWYLDNFPFLTDINKCLVEFCQIPFSLRRRTGRDGGRDHGSRCQIAEASRGVPSRLCDVGPRPRHLRRSQSKRCWGGGAPETRARGGARGRPGGQARWTRPFPVSRVRPSRRHPKRGRWLAPRRSSMTVRITTTCATSRPAGPGAARAGRGASGNCAPTGGCPAATSAGSRRSSSTASASVASASCSPGRAPVSPERWCVRAATGRGPGQPRERPGNAPVRPLRLERGTVATSWGCPA